MNDNRDNRKNDGRLLSIVVPVFNRADIVGRTLDSIAAQRRVDEVDLILVDNNSSDVSLSRLNEFAGASAEKFRSITVLTQPTPGACAARNRGLEEVTTPYVMFFDSDDEMLPDLVGEVLSAIENNPGVKLIVWRAILGQKDGSYRPTQRVRANSLLYTHIVHSVLSTQRYAVATSLIRRAGGWDETVKGWDDFELGVRLLTHRPSVTLLDAERYFVRTNYTENSLTGASFSEKQGIWEYSLDVCTNILKTSGNRRALKWIDVRRVILAADYAREGANEAAIELLSKTLSNVASASDRCKLHLLYYKQKLYRHGTGRMAALIFKKPL